MIERVTIKGRGATVAYLGEGLLPADKEIATQAKVVFDDGEHLWLNLSPEDPETSDRGGGRGDTAGRPRGGP